jgi:hypothetical protein
MKEFPATENPLAIRTDFLDEQAWQTICAAIEEPNSEYGFKATVNFISDPEYAGLTPEQLLSLVSKDETFAFIIDHVALTAKDNPILVVDLHHERGRTFRVIPSEMWGVENNLSIANMGFEEFADNVDSEGIFRGFK